MCLVIELFMFCMNKLFKSVKLTCPCLTMNLGAIFYFHQILNISGYSIFEYSKYYFKNYFTLQSALLCFTTVVYSLCLLSINPYSFQLYFFSSRISKYFEVIWFKKYIFTPLWTAYDFTLNRCPFFILKEYCIWRS